MPHGGCLIVPGLICLAGGIGRRLVHKKWDLQHWFFGIELTVAAIAGAVERFLEITLHHDNADSKVILEVAGYSLLFIFLFGMVLAIHQEWECRVQSHPVRACGAMVWANFLGFGSLALCMLKIKGL